MLQFLASKEMAGFGTPILALGMAGFAVNNYRSWLETKIGVSLSLLDDKLVFVLIVLLVVVGGSMVLVWVAAFFIRNIIVSPLRSIYRKLQNIERKIDQLTQEDCDDDDLVAISKLAGGEFQQLAASYERNKWLKEHGGTYAKVINPKGQIVGFYDLFMLSQTGVDAATRGEFDIKSCPVECLLRGKKGRYLFVYVGGVYGTDMYSKAMVLGAVTRHLINIRPKAVFARAGSKDGLRLLRSRAFVPVHAKLDNSTALEICL